MFSSQLTQIWFSLHLSIFFFCAICAFSCCGLKWLCIHVRISSNPLFYASYFMNVTYHAAEHLLYFEIDQVGLWCLRKVGIWHFNFLLYVKSKWFQALDPSLESLETLCTKFDSSKTFNVWFTDLDMGSKRMSESLVVLMSSGATMLYHLMLWFPQVLSILH